MSLSVLYFNFHILYIKVTMSVCSSVCACGQCLEDSSSHYPFLVECFGGWGKGEPGEAQGWGGGGTGGEGPGGGELDGCIMHRVHTSKL
jgi:hypothetical protein